MKTRGVSDWQAVRPASQPHPDVSRAVFGTLVCAVNVFPASPPQLLWYHCPFFTPCASEQLLEALSYTPFHVVNV